MRNLKPISRESIPLCLDKADRYRLLNDPVQAESICRDVLAIEPENQRALTILFLALTDQFASGLARVVSEAEAVLPRFHVDYLRHYYAGILWERRAVARLSAGGLGAAQAAQPLIEKAMHFYEQAERLRPHENDDALLRWNSCVRLCERYALTPSVEDDEPRPVGED